MSSLAAPVMILTTAGEKGATLSSVTSLSINPHPLIQFNLMTPSTTSTSLHENGVFALHLLKPNKESGEMARLFGKNGYFDKEKNIYVPVSPFKDLNEKDFKLLSIKDKELPILNNVERVLICEKEEIFNIQDHEIWIGKVLQVLELNHEIKTGGLLNFNRSFHKISDDSL